MCRSSVSLIDSLIDSIALIIRNIRALVGFSGGGGGGGGGGGERERERERESPCTHPILIPCVPN